MFSPLPRSFFQRSAVETAPELLGKMLLVSSPEGEAGGLIQEVEAYQGEEDQACHARSGKTGRTYVMYGPAGFTYVYFTYGMHWMLNIVTDREDVPAAVLIRGVWPTNNPALIARRRSPQPRHLWCNGPAKVCRAFDITGAQNNMDICTADAKIRISEGIHLPQTAIYTSPRIGINHTPEPWLSIPWRFFVPNIETWANQVDLPNRN